MNTYMYEMDLMSMKSSRRKQSKPIRVSYSDDSEMPLPPPQGEEEYVNGDGMDTSDPEQEKENEMHMSNITERIEHTSDIAKTESSPMTYPNESVFPTAYHRLGNEFLMKSDTVVSNGHESNAIDSENNIDKNGNDVVDGEYGDKLDGDKAKDKSGIFHPDAYCELCDKEFCNKYFLKTHKANKHGIYDNSTSPFAPSVNPLPPSLVLPQDYSSLPFKLNADFPLPPLKPNASSAKPPTPQLSMTNLPASSPRTSPPASQPLIQTPSKPPSSPLPPSKPKSSLLDLNASSSTLDSSEKKSSSVS